jgi:ADP-heptose:LPS heptosyltransferase
VDAEPRRILILRYSALGDVVLATSILEPLRRRFPAAELEWVTNAQYAPLLDGLPELSRVHPLTRWGVRDSPVPFAWKFRGRFDLVVDLQHRLRGAVTTFGAAPRRLAIRRRNLRETGKALLGRDVPLVRAHATDLYAEVLSPLGITGAGRPRVHLSPAARERAAAARAGIGNPVVALAPGTRWETKRWPVESFAALSDHLNEEGVQTVLCGGPGDAPTLVAFRAAVRHPTLADLSQLSVDALAAGLAQVDLLVSGDSGPAHLATAVGTPVLTLFGPTSPGRWGPPPPTRLVGALLRAVLQPWAHAAPWGITVAWTTLMSSSQRPEMLAARSKHGRSEFRGDRPSMTRALTRRRPMASDEDLKAELERLKAENEALKARARPVSIRSARRAASRSTG